MAHLPNFLPVDMPPISTVTTPTNSPRKGGDTDIKTTPRHLPAVAGNFGQCALRSEIARANKAEFVSCSPADFQINYMPFVPTEHDMDTCIDALVAAEHFKKQDAPDSFDEFTNFRRRGGKTEFATFKPLEAIADVIRKQKLKPRSSNGFPLISCPDAPLQSDTERADHRIDACLSWVKKGKAPTTGKAIHVANIVVPMEFKVTGGANFVSENRSQILSAAQYIMHDDARRNWVYGITIEDDRVSLWYFSRSHCAKSQSFSFGKDPRRLVAVLISLLFATQQELGYDRRITRMPSGTYIYELPQGKGKKPLWFKTLSTLFESRTLKLSGRATCVWSAIQVSSKKGAAPLESASPIALKDVWLDSTVDTEADIQSQIFEDISRFAQSDWRSDPRLSHGELAQSEILQQLSTYLEGERFKELFLCIKHHNAGAPLKPVALGAWNRLNLFTTLPEGALTQPALFSTSQRTSHRDSSARISSKPGTSYNPAAPSSGEEYRKYRAFTPKRRCFFVQEDVCQPMHDLPTFGDVVDVLKQTIIALKLMCCAGWVHRDVSTGNILTILKSDRWVAKLADLEYAKRFPTFKGSSDTKTGTMYFMPAEIRSDATYHVPTFDLEMARKIGRLDDVASSETHVIYNPQHDLESIWWIILWIITRCLAPHLRISHAKRYFSHSENATKLRRKLLQIGDKQLFTAFPQQLSSFAFEMCLLGIEMYQLYLQRGSKGVVEQVEAYSDIHHKFWVLLTKVDATMFKLPLEDAGANDAEENPSDPVNTEPPSSSLAPSQREVSPSPAPRRSARHGGSNQAGTLAGVALGTATSNLTSQDPPPRPSKRQRR